MADEKHLIAEVEAAGASNAAVIAVADIPFRPEFREACAVNSCGQYGRCWMCPPDVGDIHILIDRAKGYSRALVYQTIHPLEDSYDFEGMTEAGRLHNQLAGQLDELVRSELTGFLHLAAGSCRVCDTCSKIENEPCRFPEKAKASLESYGIAVSELAALCGLKYINGQDTVTFFGAVLFN